VEIIDLPGVYDIHGFSDDELVVRHFLESNPVDLVLIILNTTQIERQLSLALQLKQLALPAMLLLNMSDEAKKFGVTVDIEKMSQALAMPVELLSAKYGNGYEHAYQAISIAILSSQPADTQEIRNKLKLENQIEAKMESVLRHAVQVPAQMTDNLTTRLDALLLHPWLGLPLFFGVMYVLFQAIFILGKPLQDGVAWALGLFRGEILEHLLLNLPAPVQGLLLDGIYNGVGTVAAFVPMIVLIFLFLALVEDSGYLSRAAFLMDALMAKMGLDGRSFVMMLMGFGCNVPALMGTRVMRSRSLRLLSMLVIPFSLCSARLQVFVFITAALFAPRHGALVLFSLYLFSFAAALLTALLFKKHYSNSEPFILELPPYRLPTWRQIVLRGWHEVRHFLGRASKFIIAGVVLVWILTHFPLHATPASSETWAGMIGGWLAPILDPLGINQQLAIALIFGFVAKEIVIGSLAVIYGLEGSALMSTMAHQLDWVQAYSFMLFTLIYTPCLSTLATLKNESRSYAYTALALAWPLGLAWVLSFTFYQGARSLGF
ncbi:MAG: ferrous iron transport protein B, partial [Sulfurimicrobium sp.]|nr:ferrous iron transport protein B [Sulfurimicrobium sp.]